MDAVLLRRWIDARDAEAFRELAQTYLPMVYATCLRILREPNDAEDVTQECFETLAGIRGKAPSQLGPWLHRVATNKSLNFIRSCSRRARREDELARATENSADASHDEIYSLVDECIAKLPDELRVPLVTHFFEDRTHDAIAHSLGISRSAVTHRIGRAIERIREDLRRRGHSSSAFAVGASLESIRMQPVAVPVALEHVVAKLAIGGVTPAGAGTAAAVGAGLVKGALIVTTTQKALIGAGIVSAIVAVSVIALREQREPTPSAQPVITAQAPANVEAPPPLPAKATATLAKPEIRTDLAPARDKKTG